jgi:hypothetical protein
MKLLIALLAVIVIAGGIVFATRKKPAPAEMPFAELLEFLSQEAISIAKEYRGISLDYSPASVEQVETILGKLHDEYKKRGTTEGQRGLALAFGVYIGEVIRKQAGEGPWERDHPQLGESSMRSTGEATPVSRSPGASSVSPTASRTTSGSNTG